MKCYNGLAAMLKYGVESMKDLRIPMTRSLTTSSSNAAYSRIPIRVHNPEQSQIKSKQQIITTDFKDDKTQKSNISGGIFNSTMGEVMMSKSRKRIAVEGIRLVEEAIKAKLKLEKLFILKSLKDISPSLNHFLELEKQHKTTGKCDAEIHRVSAKLMQTWSSVTTPPGIIGIFQKPKSEDIILGSEKPEDNVPLTVICDNIREPGNLGSILRSAAGAGCTAVWLTKGCVDPWNMKVLRGACGAHFYIPVLSDIPTDAIQTFILKSVDHDSEESSCSKVALLVADSNLEDSRLQLPLFLHSEVDYSTYQHVFLVMGGETEGISTEIVELVKGYSSNALIVPARIRISLANNIDSLNAANAFGIIAFEMNRQLRSSR